MTTFQILKLDTSYIAIMMQSANLCNLFELYTSDIKMFTFNMFFDVQFLFVRN